MLFSICEKIFLYSLYKNPPFVAPFFFSWETWFDNTLNFTTYSFTQVSAFLTKCFSRGFQKISRYNFPCTNLTYPLAAPPYPWDYDLNKLCMRMLLYKFEIFWPFGFWDDFYIVRQRKSLKTVWKSIQSKTQEHVLRF